MPLTDAGATQEHVSNSAAFSHTGSPEGWGVVSSQPIRTILAIFVLSGAAGLTYEIVWARQLVLIFGNTTQAVSAILTGFFGGMAIGSALGGRIADRVRRPLAFYGLLEILLVAIVLATPTSFGLIHEAYRGLFNSLETSPAVLALLRFAIALLALGPATVLMGATLPTLTRYLRRQSDHMSVAFGTLYASNTIGAILGAAAAGFILIELLGLTGTLLVGASCSATAGIVAIVVDRTRSQEVAKGSGTIGEWPMLPCSAPRDGDRSRPRLALAIGFLSGLTSLAYQVLWLRLLAEGTGNTTYVFSVVLVIFLAGLAIGASAFSRAERLHVDTIDLLAIGQIAIAALVLVGTVAIIDRHAVPSFGALGSTTAVFWYLALAALVVVLPTTAIMGVTFPAASRLLSTSDEVATNAGVLLAANTLGAICGTFLVPFVVIPAIGSPASLALVAVVNALAGAALAITRRPARRRRTFLAIPGIALSIVIATGALTGRAFVDPTRSLILRSGGEVFATAEDEIAPVVAGRTGAQPQLWVTGTSMTVLSVDTKLMPTLPLMLRPDSRTALIVAFGMGSAHRSAVIDGLSVESVELVPSVPKMFGYYYADAAEILKNPNGRVIVADGRNHVELTTRSYDMIVVDPPPPIETAGVSVISSREFYSASRARLTPGGVMMQWVPFGQTVDEFRAHLRTYRDVFQHVMVAFGPGGFGTYMLGSDTPLSLDPPNAQAVLERPGVLADLSSAFDSPARTTNDWMRTILGSVWIQGDAVARFVGPGPLITDDRPLPEYFLLRRLFNPTSATTTRQVLLAAAGGS